MAKQTWINVDGTWKKVKNVWINAGGIWKSNVIPKGNINGVWKEFMSYGPSFPILYEQGFEVIPWVQGYTSNGTLTKNSYNMYLYTSAVDNSEVAVVTDIPIDVTNYNTLYLDWYANMPGFLRPKYVILDTQKMGNYTSYIARTSELRSTNNAPLVHIMDVSSLTGSYYIRIHIRNGVGAMGEVLENDVNIYKIWLE